jgi:4-aminobutyrate aminotransferase/4-aminobutyrate aminotransferase/(S)-3-amino-2-methylpropionate transaminase
MQQDHPIVGHVKGKGLLWASNWSKTSKAKNLFNKAGELVYQKAFAKGLAWIPAGHILRIVAAADHRPAPCRLGLDIIEEAIAETEKEFDIEMSKKTVRFGIIGLA